MVHHQFIYPSSFIICIHHSFVATNLASRSLMKKIGKKIMNDLNSSPSPVGCNSSPARGHSSSPRVFFLIADCPVAPLDNSNTPIGHFQYPHWKMSIPPVEHFNTPEIISSLLWNRMTQQRAGAKRKAQRHSKLCQKWRTAVMMLSTVNSLKTTHVIHGMNYPKGRWEDKGISE